MQTAKTVMVLDCLGQEVLNAKLPKKLRLVETNRRDAEPMALCDTFDQGLGLSGRLLVQIGGDWVLFDRDGMVAQDTAPHPPFVQYLTKGPLREALSDVPALRALLPLVDGQCRRHDLSLLDDEDKTVARVSLLALSSPSGAIALATLHGVRGYDKALDRLCAALAPNALQPGDMAEQVHARDNMTAARNHTR